MIKLLQISLIISLISSFGCVQDYKWRPKFHAGECIKQEVETWEIPNLYKILQVGKDDYEALLLQSKYSNLNGKYKDTLWGNVTDGKYNSVICP